MSVSASSSRRNRSTELIGLLSSARTPFEAKLKCLRELKNQIIGNPTKKCEFLSLGAVPCIVSILSAVVACMHSRDGRGNELNDSMAIQAAVAIASFAYGLKSGVEAILDAGAFPILMRLVSHRIEKVVDASARAIKLIYQSELAPNFDFLIEINMNFLFSLLNSKNEKLSNIGANIIIYSCRSTREQQALSDAGIVMKLVHLLEGSLNQREASIASIHAVLKGNPEIIRNFFGLQNGRIVNVVTELVKDKNPRTRLLACSCLIIIRNTCTSYFQDAGIRTGLVLTLLDLLDYPGQVGDDAPSVLSSLIAEREDMQKIAFDAKVVDKLCNHLQKGPLKAKRLQGIFSALAGMCSSLECCRKRVLSFEVSNFIRAALEHVSLDVRIAAREFLRNLSGSVKNWSAGQSADAVVTASMVQLLCGSQKNAQLAALGAISNMLVGFTANKAIFMQCGCLKQQILVVADTEASSRESFSSFPNLVMVPILSSMVFLRSGFSSVLLEAHRTAKVEVILQSPIDCLFLVLDMGKNGKSYAKYFMI